MAVWAFSNRCVVFPASRDISENITFACSCEKTFFNFETSSGIRFLSLLRSYQAKVHEFLSEVTAVIVNNAIDSGAEEREAKLVLRWPRQRRVSVNSRETFIRT